MSIASELNRLLQAKSDLATAIANKGVTVPANATLDDYAALVDSIQTGGGGSTLPYDAEVEYLQGDGAAYIDTGMKAAGTFHIKTYLVDFFTSTFLGNWPFGGRTAYNNNAFGMFIAADTNKINVAYNGNTLPLATYSSYQQSCWVEIKGGSINIGSTTYALTAKTFTSSYNVILFGLNNGGSIINSRAKIGKTLLYDGTTMMYLIPVRVGQVGYFYDIISETLIGNAGTGSFILGNDVV